MKKICIKLICSKNDSLLSFEYQKELWNFYNQFPNDLKIQKTHFAMDSVASGTGGTGLSGEFIITVMGGAVLVIKQLIQLLATWLNSRPGRKLKVKFDNEGNYQYEVNTIEELEKIFQLQKQLSEELKAAQSDVKKVNRSEKNL